MQDNLFDEFIKDKLQNHSSHIPDGLWEKIMPKEEERKPLGFWWRNNTALLIGIGLLLVAASGVYVYTNLSSSKTLLTTTNHSADINNKDNAATINNAGDKSSASNSYIHQQETTEPKTESAATITNNNGNTSELNHTTTPSIPVVDLKDNASIKKEHHTDKINAGHLASNELSNTVNDDKTTVNATENDITNDNSTIIASHYSNKKMSRLNTIISTNKNSIHSAALSKQNRSLLSNDNFLTAFNKKSTNNELYFSTLKLSDANTIIDKNPPLELGKLFMGGEDCPTTRGVHRNDVYIEGYFSLDMNKKIIRNLSSTDAYIKKKDSTESMKLGYSVGFRLTKSIGERLLLKTGVQFSQINETFRLQTENERKVTTTIITRTIVRPGMSDTMISDTTRILQIGYSIKNYKNSYKSFEVPIIVSYELGNKPDAKWMMTLNGGVIINATSWYSGATIDPTGNTINLKNNTGYYTHEFGFSLYGGLGVIRKITNDLDLFAEPYFRYGLYNVNSGNRFNQRFNAAGINFGTRFKINFKQHF